MVEIGAGQRGPSPFNRRQRLLPSGTSEVNIAAAIHGLPAFSTPRVFSGAAHPPFDAAVLLCFKHSVSTEAIMTGQQMLA